MRKIFLIPLMTLVCSVMAWAGNEAKIGETEYATLKAAIDAAPSGATIDLLDDVSYTDAVGTANLNINKSLTIKGHGHTISGYSRRSGKKQFATIWINLVSPSASNINVTFDSVKIVNNRVATSTYPNGSGSDWAIHTRGKIGTVTITNSELQAFSTALQIGGAQATLANVVVENSKLIATKYYSVVSYNPYNMTITDSYVKGWAGLYFKGVDGSYGSRGTTVNATRTTFECPNPFSGRTNAFGALVCEDDGITLNLTNCDINSSAYGDQAQSVFVISTNWNIWQNATYRPTGAMPLQPIALVIDGDNTHIDMNGYYYSDINVKAVETFKNSSWYRYAANNPGSQYDEYMIPFSVTMKGGTYDVNPYYYRHVTKVNRDEDGNPIMTEDGYSVVAQSPIIPAGYAVQEVNDGGKTRYRIIHTDNISYNINGNYEEEGAGDNPTTSFIVEAADAENAKIELVNNATEAAYVQVRDNANDVATTLAVGKMDGEDKVNQTLVVNNGLDVQGNSQVTVQSGSTLEIGEGGIVTEKPENIVIEADENGAASLLLDPAITVNQTPNLTVRMTAKQIGRKDGDFFWHRFAMPVKHIETWEKEGDLPDGSTYPTYVYAWDYNNNEWKSITPKDMLPLQGYTLTLASNWINADGTDADDETNNGLNELQDVVYIFKGNLFGNTDQPLNFKAEGFNFFGNSYTGYMDVKKMLEGIQTENIDGTAYMWCNDPQAEEYQSYVGTSMHKIKSGKGLESWQKEIAPMQTFILRLRGADSANENVNYVDAIWGNPRYGHNSNNSGAGAPRRSVATISEDTYMEISVKAANGMGSRVDFTESANNSDAFESGYDVEKYMNEKRVNLFATVEGMNLSSVVTDNIEGKTLSLQTNGELAYTMTFKNVEGEEYAIRDNATGRVIAIEESATYEFAAQPNSLVENRFEIIPAAKMPTAIDDVEVKANVKGIYTIMGQYLGENFSILPAGVYVVDGVKIVK